MSIAILTTKFFIPHPGIHHVSRARLVQRLVDGAQQKLVLISAPPGAGKTALLAEWIAQSGIPAAWLSLDAEDSEPVRFWTYVISALQRVATAQDGTALGAAALGAAALQALRGSQPAPIESALTLLLNDLAGYTPPLVLVLDDYHVLSNPLIHQGVTFFVEHLSPGKQLVISSRADPSLPLARLRARQQMIELRASDLRFTLDETAAFMVDQVGLDLTQDAVKAINERTEGWAVGLQLAGLSMHGRTDLDQVVTSFTGGHHYILEYLTEEVLARQPERSQHFLLHTSILDRFCGPLCDAVTGQTGGSEMLGELFRANLFLVPLDDEYNWFRYHHLFADLLNGHLKKTITPQAYKALYLKASRWFEQNGFISEAFKYALQAENYDLAADLAENNQHAMMTHGELTTLLTWIHALPEEMVRTRPRLSVPKAWALVFEGKIEEALAHAAQAEEVLRSGQDPEADFILGSILTVRAFVADRSGDSENAFVFAQEADRLLPPNEPNARSMLPYILGRAYKVQGKLAEAEEAFARSIHFGRKAGNILTELMGQCEVASIRKLQGRLRDAQNIYEETVKLKREHETWLVSFDAVINVGWSDWYRESNDLLEARQKAESVIKNLEGGQVSGSAPSDFIFAYATLVDTLTALGDHARAQAALQKMEIARSRSNLFPEFESAVNASRIKLWLASGRLEEAVGFASEQQIGQKGSPITRERENIALAKIWHAQGRFEEALTLLSTLEEAARSGGRYGSLIEILALRSLCLNALGKEDAAFTALEQSLSLAQPEGYRRVFLDLGDPLEALLQALDLRAHWKEGALKGYAAALLASFAPGPQPRALEMPDQGTLLEPLSRRELEVLDLVCRGYANREIAEMLFITQHTVKKHTSNIYSKLGVTSRTQAIAKARELGLG